MHRGGFSYRVLRPSMVRIIARNSDVQVYLESPDFLWTCGESRYLESKVKTETDFMLYDCKCLSSLMVYYFETMQENRLKRKTEQRRS